MKPADEPILEAKFKPLPGQRGVSDWLEFLRTRVSILEGMPAFAAVAAQLHVVASP